VPDQSSNEAGFQGLVQELAASLVLAKPGDLSTFQPVLRT